MSTVNDKAVLWDLDGTILDSLTVMNKILDEVFPRYQIKTLSREQINLNHYGPLEESIMRMSRGKGNKNQLIKDYLEEQLKYYENPITHNGIVEVIKRLKNKNVKQAIVTSRRKLGRDGAGPNAIIKTLELTTHLPVIISGDDIENHKPHPEPILKALSILSIEPKNTVMIGDQPVDIEAAHAAGCKAIFADYDNIESSSEFAKTSKPDAICNDSEEIESQIIKILDL